MISKFKVLNVNQLSLITGGENVPTVCTTPSGNGTNVPLPVTTNGSTSGSGTSGLDSNNGANGLVSSSTASSTVYVMHSACIKAEGTNVFVRQ